MPGKAKILLMDDEQIILDMTRDVLDFLNYDVMFAKDGIRGVCAVDKVTNGVHMLEHATTASRILTPAQAWIILTDWSDNGQWKF